MSRLTEVFISYARPDEELMRAFSKHLYVLVHSGQIQPWTDRCLEPGELWEPQIQHKLQSADIIIPLISANYWSASFAPMHELPTAIARAQIGQATLVPIILKPCMWLNSPISQFTVLPEDGKPVSTSTDIDSTFAQITDKLCELATTINKRKAMDNFDPPAQHKADQIGKLLPPNIQHNPPRAHLVYSFPHPGRVTAAAFSRTSSKFATTCDDGRVRIFDVANLAQEALIHSRPKSLQSVSWSRTGREIATSDSDGSVRIWRDKAEVRQLPVGQGSAWDAEYSPDGAALAVGSQDGSVSVWAPRRSLLKWKRKVHNRDVNSVRFNCSGDHLVTSSSDGHALVLDAEDGRELSRFSRHNGRVSIALFVSAAFNAETSCMSSGEDGRLFLWSIRDPAEYVEIAKHTFWVRTLTCSLDGDLVVSAGYDASIKFIDARSGVVFESAAVDRGPIYCVRLSLYADLLVVGADDCHAYLFSLT